MVNACGEREGVERGGRRKSVRTWWDAFAEEFDHGGAGVEEKRGRAHDYDGRE